MHNKKVQKLMTTFFLFAFVLQPINSFAATNTISKPASKTVSKTVAPNKASILSPRQLIIGKWSTLYKNQPIYVEFNKNGTVSISGSGIPSNQGKLKYTLADITGSKNSIIVKSAIFYSPTNDIHSTNSTNKSQSPNNTGSKTPVPKSIAVTVVFKDNNTMIFQGITFIRVKK